MSAEIITPKIETERFLPLITTALEKTASVDWRPITSSEEGQLSLTIVQTILEVFKPYLQDPKKLIEDGLTEKWEKPGTAPGFGYDWLGEEVLSLVLQEAPFACLCFSEERGWQTYGEKPQCLAIVDPLDESINLIRRIEGPERAEYQNQGTAITFAEENGNFLCAALADFQTGELIFEEKEKPPILLTVQEGKIIPCSQKLELRAYSDRPIIIGSLFQKVDRKGPFEKTRLYALSEVIENPDILGVVGVMRFLKGEAHFLIDPFKGQPWYEMPIYSLVQNAGGSVIDLETGEKFSLPSVLERAQKEPGLWRVKFVAGTSPEKTCQLVRILKKSSNPF